MTRRARLKKKPEPPKQRRFRWTAEQDKLLEELYRNNVSFEDMAEMVGHPLTSVKKRVQRFETRYIHHPWKRMQVKLAIQMRRDGYPCRVIAEAVGHSINSTLAKLNEYGVKALNRWTEIEKAFLRNNFYRLRIPFIADELNKTVSSVRNMALKMGLRVRNHAGKQTQETEA